MNETFKIELVCIVDSNDGVVVVARTERKNTILPGLNCFTGANVFSYGGIYVSIAR